MAVDVCAEIPGIVISPRISFSHDLNQSDAVPIENYQHRSDPFLVDSSSDFDFCVSKNFTVQEFSTADELFSNGKILPFEVKKKIISKEIPLSEPLHLQFHPPPPTPTSTQENSKKMRLKEFLSASSDAEENEKPSHRSFWQFRRSSSLNCDNTRSRGLIRSLQFLSRSNSTGSALNPKQTVLPKDNQKQHLRKQSSVSSSKSSVSSCSSPYYYYQYSSQRPPLKKNCRAYGDVVRISPVLNLHPPCISKATVGLFGLSSLFCNGKDKRKKK